MTTIHTLTPPPVTRPVEAPPTARSPRGWAWAGVGAGVIGLAVFLLSGALVVPEEAMADNAEVLTHVLDGEASVWAFQTLTVLAAGLLAVFGTGLRRTLAAQEPAGSLLPDLALVGALLTSGTLLVGGGISTELFWSLTRDAAEIDPDTVAANLGIFNTIAWVWVGIGLSAGKVAVAALRHGAVARWVGWVSAAMAALVAVTQVVPLQYLALVPGSLWLLVAGTAFGRRERSV